MPFIGNQPALAYTSFAKQDFTTSATTSYTLDNPVTNANELALFINFVRQEPTTAYSASGTSLTLTSATSASDDMYCVFLGKAVQTVNPANASVGASQIVDSSIALGKLSATGTKDATTFLRGDNTFAVAGGTNTPAFEATRSSNQTITHDTMTKIATNVEVFDTDGCYDHSTNYRFLPTTAGKYYVYTQATASIGIEQLNRYSLLIRKNGNNYKVSSKYFNNNPARIITSFIGAVIDFNGSSDYVEFFTKIEYASSGTIEINGDSTELTFGGYRILT